MVEERRPTKKVVKKVVKKTVVVRHTQPGSTKVAPAPSSRTVRAPLAKLKAKTSRARPSIRIPSPPRRPGAGLAARARLVGSRIGDRASDARFSAGQATRRGAQRVRDLRLPHLPPTRAAAATGAVAGLLSVALGWLSYELFSATRGTTAGGGWGALALVVVAFVTYAVGELLLEGFGIAHARVISAMSIMVVLVLVLTFFLELAAGPAAWILIPVLGLISFVVSCRVILATDQATNHR
jgi:hypothetical protein